MPNTINIVLPEIYKNFDVVYKENGEVTFDGLNKSFRNYLFTANDNFILRLENIRNGGDYKLLVVKDTAADVVITLPAGSTVLGNPAATTIILTGANNEQFLIEFTHNGTGYVFWQEGSQVALGQPSAFSPNVIPFINSAGEWDEDALFSYDGAANQLISKYSKTEVVEFKNSGYLKVYNYGVGGADTTQLVILGKNIGGQTALSTPTGSNLLGGVLIGNNIIPGFTSDFLGTKSVLIGNNIYTHATGSEDTSINVSIGTNIGGQGIQNQGVVIGNDALALSTIKGGYNINSGHRNTYIGQNVAVRANGGGNVAIGHGALASFVSGNSNVAIGFNSGCAGDANNSSIGSASYNPLNYSRAIFLGRGARLNGDWSDLIVIGTGIQAFQSNMMTIGNLIYGTGMTTVSNQTVSPGFVGIGLNSPSARLHVKSASATSGSAFKVETSIFTVMEIENNANIYLYGQTMFGTAGDIPQAKVDIKSGNGYEQFILRTQYTPSSSMDSNGAIGSIWFDDDYMYRKTSTGQIKRVQLTIF